MTVITQFDNTSQDFVNTQVNLTLSETSTTNISELEDIDLRYGFILGDYGLLIPEEAESEVISEPQIFTIPNTSDLMVGLISLRGHFTPVFDLGKMINVQPKGDTKSIIAIKLQGHYLAFPFERAISLELPPPISDNQLTFPEILNQFSGTIYHTNQGYWIEFDFKSCIDKFSGMISQL